MHVYTHNDFLSKPTHVFFPAWMAFVSWFGSITHDICGSQWVCTAVAVSLESWILRTLESEGLQQSGTFAERSVWTLVANQSWMILFAVFFLILVSCCFRAKKRLGMLLLLRMSMPAWRTWTFASAPCSTSNVIDDSASCWIHLNFQVWNLSQPG